MATLHEYTDCSTDWGFDDYVVKQIPRTVASDFLKEYHYSGGAGNAIMPWGLYEQVNGQLVGVGAFQTPISENTRASIFEDIDGPASKDIDECGCSHINREHGYREHVTELHRLALVPECPHNTATWFISRLLKRLKEHKPKYRAVISMADSTEGHEGTIYQAANADYYGRSGETTFFRDQQDRLRNPRQNGENINLSDAKERGWKPEKRKAKHRYVFWLPDRHQSKEQLRQLAEVELQPYP